MHRNRFVLFSVFVVTGCACGLLWWHSADRWTYYDDYPNGLQPKFPVPAWWLVAESSGIGVFGGGVVTAACLFLPRLFHTAKGA